MAPQPKSLTKQIILWMVAGLILGVFSNLFLMELGFYKSFFVEGLFHVGGKLFINALKMLVVPLVTFSLIAGVLGIGDVRTLGRVGVKSLVMYLITTAMAITLGLSVTAIFQPGKNFDMQSAGENTFTAQEAPPLSDVFINLIPGNPVSAYANGDMLPIIFYTLLLGICLVMVGKKAEMVGQLVEQMNRVIMQMVSLVMMAAPFGVFCLMTKTFSEQGIALLLPMGGYFLLVLACLLLHVFGTMPLIIRFIGGLNPILFMKKMRGAQIFAFSTASSNATIPVTLRTVEEKMGVDNSVASFTVPFGATINMDGTAIMQGVATVFIANVYNIDLNLFQYLLIIGMAVLASIGTAGVPGVGLIMLAMVFNQVGLPVEGIGLILGVDRLLDMVRTAVNITGDATITVLVAKSEGKLEFGKFRKMD